MPMPLPLAETLVVVLTSYLAGGVVFAVAFAMRGAARIDPAARDGTVGFRFLLLPGATLLWPLLAYRWLRGRGEPPTERNAHRRAVERDPR